jgi:putative ABC transport system permease protein
MFSLDRWREIWDTLVANKLRTVLTMLAMSWGIFMLVVLLGLGAGLQHGVASGFEDDATNSVWIFGGQTSIAHAGLPLGRRISFDNRDVDRTKGVRGVEYLTGRFYFSSSEMRIKAGDKVTAFDVRAVHPDHLYLEKTIMVIGRFINDFDVERRRKVCVIGLPIADYFFGRRDVVGRWLQIGNFAFQIVGVFDDEGGEGEQRKIYVPITTAQASWGGTQKVHQLMFTVGDADETRAQAIGDSIKAQLAAAHGFSAADPQATRVRNNVEQFERIHRIFAMVDLFIWLMGICTIVAGVVGVSNIMMIIVRERTKEIGIRKALGATPFDIVSTILQESIVLTGAAGYFGLVAGVGLLTLMSSLIPPNPMFSHPEVDLTVAVAATFVLVAAGAIAGFFPARAAARVNPIVALRDE